MNKLTKYKLCGDVDSPITGKLVPADVEPHQQCFYKLSNAIQATVGMPLTRLHEHAIQAGAKNHCECHSIGCIFHNMD